MKIAVAITSRGFIFAEVIESVLRELKGYEHEIFFTTGLPIPDCFNDVTEKALAYKPDFIWYVEEDTVPPKGSLKKMIAMDANYVTIDSPVGDPNNSISCLEYTSDGDVLWSGMGCLLVKPHIFTLYPKPYFRSDISFEMRTINGKTVYTPMDVPMGYGGQDVYFGWKLNELGVKLKVLPGECRHLLIELNPRGKVNDGCHRVYARSKLKKE